MPNSLVWVVQYLHIYWDFPAQPSLGFTEYGLKKTKYTVTSSSLWEDSLLIFMQKLLFKDEIQGIEIYILENPPQNKPEQKEVT